LCRISYAQALSLFKQKHNAWGRGFYCSEIVEALSKAQHQYKFSAYNSARHLKLAKQVGTIVFVGPSTQYPSGHFLLRVDEGWMNPWSNFPQMCPVRSDVVSKLPGKITYLVYEA